MIMTKKLKIVTQPKQLEKDKYMDNARVHSVHPLASTETVTIKCLVLKLTELPQRAYLHVLTIGGYALS